MFGKGLRENEAVGDETTQDTGEEIGIFIDGGAVAGVEIGDELLRLVGMEFEAAHAGDDGACVLRRRGLGGRRHGGGVNAVVMQRFAGRRQGEGHDKACCGEARQQQRAAAPHGQVQIRRGRRRSMQIGRCVTDIERGAIGIGTMRLGVIGIGTRIERRAMRLGAVEFCATHGRARMGRGEIRRA